MNLYRVMHADHPTVYFKALTANAAIEAYKDGFDDRTSIRPQDIDIARFDTLEDLMAVLPDEFAVHDDTDL